MSLALRTTMIGTTVDTLLLAAQATVAAKQDAAKGQAVYAAQKCSVCHSIQGKGADEIRQWIVNPTEITAKTRSTAKPPMPNRYGKLPAAEIDAMVAYLQSQK